MKMAFERTCAHYAAAVHQRLRRRTGYQRYRQYASAQVLDKELTDTYDIEAISAGLQDCQPMDGNRRPK
jgi:hypothetical protein